VAARSLEFVGLGGRVGTARIDLCQLYMLWFLFCLFFFGHALGLGHLLLIQVRVDHFGPSRGKYSARGLSRLK